MSADGGSAKLNINKYNVGNMWVPSYLKNQDYTIMKIFSGVIIGIAALIFIPGCRGKGTAKNDALKGNDSITVGDTGFTGIKQYMSGSHLVMEQTFENGVKEGLMKSYYANGKLRRTFWYEKGLREDSAKWYYEEGQLFRSTPYKRDTVDGIQVQYFRNGRVKAKLGFKKGMRTLYFEEFNSDSKVVGGYPDLIVNIKDDYQARGIYRVSLKLSDNSTKVRYYRGDLSSGVFDTTLCIKIKTIDGIGNLDLKKTGTPKFDYVDVIAEILTNYGNNYLVHKKIDLPYSDLN